MMSQVLQPKSVNKQYRGRHSFISPYSIQNIFACQPMFDASVSAVWEYFFYLQCDHFGRFLKGQGDKYLAKAAKILYDFQVF